MKTWPTASYASFLHRNAAILKPRGQRPSPQVGHSLPAQMPEMCVLGQAAVHHPPTFGTSGECACVKWSRFYFLCSGCVAVSRLSCWEFVTPRDACTHKDAQQHLQGSGWEFWNWKYCLRCDFMLLSDYIWVKVSGLCKATEPWQSKTEPHSSLMPLLSLQKSAVQTDRQDTGWSLCRNSPASALMRERSNSRAELLSLSSSSSGSSKRVLMWLYCCVISTLSKSVVEVMAVAIAVGQAAGWPRASSGGQGEAGNDRMEPE